MSLTPKFAEVFVRRIQNVQILIKVENTWFSSYAYFCISSQFFLPIPNLSHTSAALVAQLFQRTSAKLCQLYSWCEPRISCIFL